MLKKTITYVDYDGEERVEDFYFNLTKAELTEMNLSVNGGLLATIEKISQEKDMPKMIQIFKDLILKSYGEKSLDGKRFIKNAQLTEEFTQTEAYSQLFMLLATNADEAAAFIAGIVPKDISESIKDQTPSAIDQAKAKANVASLDNRPTQTTTV